ncbi:M56 family metallopeptidase [Algibacter sp. PT7-4]|uniref:M56 family metallopeptidase n=1 Tax=Algibacter ulvanivorans TaxID=3400999 RepID=UPI003AABD00F
MEYLLKSSAIIIIFYGLYNLLLHRDTFFSHNRWFLLVGILAAVILPVIVIPIYIEYTPINTSNLTFKNAITTQNNSNLELKDILLLIYSLGVLFFVFKFCFQLASLGIILFENKKIKRGKYTFIETQKNISPFSFFKWIVYNPKHFNKAELQQIIAHEKTHAKQYHTIDILITQLACIALWFNPFMWLYNKNLKQNLEFLADRDTLNSMVCKKTYQYTLLKTSVPTHQLALSNNFYNSLIKKRIVMLQKTKSKKINLIKYALAIPVLAIFLMSFNTKKVYVEKTNPINNIVPNISLESSTNTKTGNKNTIAKKDIKAFIITKKTTNTEFENLKEKLKQNGVTLKIKGIKRNADGNITSIKIEAHAKNSNASFNLNSDEAISPIKIAFEKGGKNISIGNANVKNNNITYVIKDKNDDIVVHEIKKSLNNKSAIFISDDEDNTIYEVNGDSIHFTTNNDKKHKIIKTVEVIKSDDENGIIEIVVDDEDDTYTTEDITIIKSDAPEKVFKIKTNKNGDNKNEFIIKTDSNKEPLYFINGKIATKKDIKTLNKNNIKSMNVYKGEAAIKKHGEAAKDGVVEITTKNE